MYKPNFPLGKSLLLAVGAVVLSPLLWAGDATPAPAKPLVEILATDPSALSGASSGAFTIVRQGETTNELVVNYAISGTASNGVDYVKIPGSMVIPLGFLASDLVIQPIIDPARRGNKTVVLTLETNANYRLAAHKRAALTIVDDTFNNVAPAVKLVSPTNGAVFTLPANIDLKAEATDSDDTIQRVSFYADDHFLGKATNAPFMLTWSNAPAGSYTLFARATDSLGKSTLSEPVEIVVTNDPPKVTLISPTPGQIFNLAQNKVDIKASATDSDDTIAKMEIFGDGHRLAVFSNAGPYALTWTNVAPGKHSVVARATDSFGIMGSAYAQFTISNAPPKITLAAPKDGDNFKAPATINLTAEASDSDGSIRYVSFYANNHYLGMETQSPYTFAWKHVQAGVYNVKAVATDKYGARSTSDSATISVSK